MDEPEFDKFADEYAEVHGRNIRASGEGPEFFARYKVQDAVELLAPRAFPGPLRILDFGAGVGTSVQHFCELLEQPSVVCLDVSSRSLELGRQRLGSQAEFVRFDGVSIPYDDATFHLVFAACVFHHIDSERHVALLREIRRVLVDGGLLLLFEHNPFNPLTRQAVSSCPFDEHAVLIRASQMKARCREAGFRRITRRYRIFFPGALRRLRPLERFLSQVPLGAQYYLAAEKTDLLES